MVNVPHEVTRLTPEQFERWCELAGKYQYDAGCSQEAADRMAYDDVVSIAKSVDIK